MFGRLRPGYVTGSFGLLAGILIYLQALKIPESFSYDGVGPSTYPKILSIGLVIAGLICIVEAARGEADEDREEYGHFLPVAGISAALLSFAFFGEALGWVLMSGIIFALATAAFGERRFLVNAAIGLLFGLGTYIVFSIGLGIYLPVGFVQSIIDFFQ